MIDLAKCPPKFQLGRLMATPGAIALGIDFALYINRHVRGDWGGSGYRGRGTKRRCHSQWVKNPVSISYSNINDLYRDLAQLGISRDHWINQEAIRFKKHNVFERTNVRLRHVPARLVKISFDCECGRSFMPDWLKKTYPTTCFYLGENKYLNQRQVNVKCPYCHKF